jgi:hypothetical protein
MKIITRALVGTIAGAVALGSAAPAMAQYDRRGEYRHGYNNGYNGYARAGDPRSAVAQCVSAAQRSASRYSYGRAQVTQIRDVDARRDGYTVRGRIAVNSGRDWRGGDRYGNGWNNRHRGYDDGSFTCRVRYGQVADLDFSGIRGL